MKDKKNYYKGLIRGVLQAHDWVTYEKVMSMSETKEAIEDRRRNFNISSYTDYNVLKKAFNDVISTIPPNEIQREGGKRNRQYRYTGMNCLSDQNGAIIKNFKRYWEFCQDSGGFFPESWLNYFFQDTANLLKLKEQKKQPLICVSLDRALEHIEYLPQLYEHIKKKHVLKLTYIHHYDETLPGIIVHPHFLKEYNGRWFLLGVDTTGDYKKYALDRIKDYCAIDDATFIPAKDNERKYWSDLIGVSRQEGLDSVVHIEIKTHSNYMHGLFVSKRFHPSQQEVLPFGNHEGEEFGLLSIDIIPNKEFFGRMLLYGNEIEVTSPISIREEIKKRIQALSNRYSE